MKNKWRNVNRFPGTSLLPNHPKCKCGKFATCGGDFEFSLDFIGAFTWCDTCIPEDVQPQMPSYGIFKYPTLSGIKGIGGLTDTRAIELMNDILAKKNPQAIVNLSKVLSKYNVSVGGD